MKLDVPYKSQMPYELDEAGEKKWCGVACVGMILAYYLKDKAPEIKVLLEKYGQSLEDGGFVHNDFIQIARDYGLSGFRKSWWAEPGVQQLLNNFRAEGETEEDIQSWIQTNIDESLYSLEQFIQGKIPVILTVTKNFRPSEDIKKRINHLVVLIGVEDDNFVIHDPLEKGENFKISREDFKKYWLRQAIIIKPV